MPIPVKELSAAQRQRSERFGTSQCVDMHCHCLPCVDDGPSSQIETLALCRALVDDGITTAIATPHQLGRYQGRNAPAAIRQAVAALNRALMVEGIPLNVLPGGDVRIDERLERLLAEDQVLTLGDGKSYVLLELPHETFIDPLMLLKRLSAKGIIPIMSHPERHRIVTANPHVVTPWLAAGAVLQLTAGSLTGDFGNTARRAAWYWLETGEAALVASDAHDTHERPPRMTDAIRLIAKHAGEAVAHRVCIENPSRVLEGKRLTGHDRLPDPVF